MTSLPRPCHPHYCPFDSPACPERCKCLCNKVKPDCISVTAQEALNIPERMFGNLFQTIRVPRFWLLEPLRQDGPSKTRL
ncbi:uncharacterized protein NPIL_646401 [Nephila pilipes]|uniref:Uncharacterized protein n=1 Tax=Nephila pilipes TaxID=299642 RepID=A0A8X6NB30_NEPPI|nr:uncharacterized protein NPIL_646401 [Nephila pilipes]